MDCQLLSNGTVICEQTYGFWIQTGAISVSAIAAILLIYDAHSTARKRATIDLVLQQKLDAVLIDAKKKFSALRKHHQANPDNSFTSYACDLNALENECIFIVLNNYEFAAAGIRNGAFDEKSYKRMLYSLVVKDWDALKGYVTELRTKRSHLTLFQEFEWLAERWKLSPLEVNK